MSYDTCLTAAGATVLAFEMFGDYQGDWLALTPQGFYAGSYGSCSGCDWQEGEHVDSKIVNDDYDARALDIDTGIGKKLLETPPMDLAAVLIYIDKSIGIEADKAIVWANAVWKAKV